MHEGVNDLLLVFSFTGLVFSFAANCGYLHRLCSLRAAQFIGKVSYSIYLIQGLVTMLFMACLQLPAVGKVVPPIYTASFLPALLYMLAYLAFLVGLSTITYYGLENPCRSFINRTFTARNKRRPNVSEVSVLLPPE
jgi:peptidoglycan/LPS O-acetylase OafA/YrhL